MKLFAGGLAAQAADAAFDIDEHCFFCGHGVLLVVLLVCATSGRIPSPAAAARGVDLEEQAFDRQAAVLRESGTQLLQHGANRAMLFCIHARTTVPCRRFLALMANSGALTTHSHPFL